MRTRSPDRTAASTGPATTVNEDILRRTQEFTTRWGMFASITRHPYNHCLTFREDVWLVSRTDMRIATALSQTGRIHQRLLCAFSVCAMFLCASVLSSSAPLPSVGSSEEPVEHQDVVSSETARHRRLSRSRRPKPAHCRLNVAHASVARDRLRAAAARPHVHSLGHVLPDGSRAPLLC